MPRQLLNKESWQTLTLQHFEDGYDNDGMPGSFHDDVMNESQLVSDKEKIVCEAMEETQVKVVA